MSRKKIGYRWHLRRLMAEREMYRHDRPAARCWPTGASRCRGSRSTGWSPGVPERLSLATLAALCDILGCQPGDLIEPVAQRRARQQEPPGAGAAAPAGAGPGHARTPAHGDGPLPGRP